MYVENDLLTIAKKTNVSIFNAGYSLNYQHNYFCFENFKVLMSFKITCIIFFDAVLANIGKCKSVYFDKVAGEQ